MTTSTDRLLLLVASQKQQSSVSSPTPTAWLAVFQAWSAQGDLGPLPIDHFRLLPPLCQQLERAGAVHSWMGRLKGV